jgi:hypothetical protein
MPLTNPLMAPYSTGKTIFCTKVALGIPWAVRKQGVMRAQMNACGALDQFRILVVLVLGIVTVNGPCSR